MASLIAAVAHDLDHPGVNQPFLIATSNHLATLYEVNIDAADLCAPRRRFNFLHHLLLFLLTEHFGVGKPPLAVGGRLSAREPCRGETQPHTTGSRIADKFADLGHGHYETTGILEKIQREFCEHPTAECRKCLISVVGS